MRWLAATLLFLVAAGAGVRTQRPPQPLGRGVITGRVVDSFGDPVLNARIVAETRGADGASRGVAATDSDDRGEYRIGRLPPGSYVVAMVRVATVVVTPGPMRAQITYYPAASTATDAETIAIDDDEHDDVDFVTAATTPALPPAIAARREQLAAAGRRPTTGSSTVRGRVTTPAGAAVAHAHVVLTSATDPLQARVGVADADGRFEFGELPAGVMRITASKPGLAPVTATGGGMVIAGFVGDFRDVTTREGETSGGVDLHLTRLGAMSGRVVNEDREPVEGATIDVLQLRYVAGRRRLVPAPAVSRATDDLGRYRIYGIAPGQYVVAATVAGARSADAPGYAPSYYPATADPAGAQFVAIGLAQDLDGVDIGLTRTRTATIRGKVIGVDGQPMNPGSLTLLTSVRSASPLSLAIGAKLKADGGFEFPNVPPGQYVIRADRGRDHPSAEGAFGTLPVVVDGSDVNDLIVTTSGGSSITGRFVFNARDATTLPRAAAFELRPLAVDPDLAPQSVATADIHDDWTFEMTGVTGPRRLQLTRTPPGWALQEILVRGVDVADRPLAFGRREQSLSGVEVRLIDRTTLLKGDIVDADAHGVPSAALIVFASDRSRWYPMSRYVAKVSAGADGAFTIAGLPFGSYYAAAMQKVPVAGDDWQDPAFLETLIPRATSVTVSESETRPVRLTVRD